MEEFELLTHMEKVQAPVDFERRVMAQLTLRKKSRQRKRRMTLSLITATASLVAVIVAVNVLVRPGPDSQSIAGLEKPLSTGFQTQSPSTDRIPIFPITEGLDFSGEFRQVNHQPRTIYILEQVSDRTDTRIIY